MKKAFTLFELVLVVIVVGILSVAIVPRLSDDSLQKAAQQLIFHLNYTKHLAMMEDRFDATDPTWYKTRWQLYFSYCKVYHDERDGLCAYTIFSDKLGHHTGNPDPAEVAVNPLDTGAVLTGGMGGNLLVKYHDREATKSLNIGKKYNIQKVRMHHCGSSAKRIAFDYLGRPIVGNLATSTAPYQRTRILKRTCEIILTNRKGDEITVLVEPETGYVHLKS